MYLLCATSIAGLAASARFAIAPPLPNVPSASLRAPAGPDMAAEAYAVLFARRYLTWSAAEPQAGVRALEPFLGTSMEADAGLELPQSGEQRVEWAEVVQARESSVGEHVYTVAAQTDTAGLLYLTVTVARVTGGGLALAGYPAFVGAPAAGPPQPPARMREVGDPSLVTVVQRALRNYLAASSSELAADLSEDAHVSLPAMTLSLDSVQRLGWAPGGGAVLAIVQAQDARGVHYTLAYEMDVLRAQGRWEVSAVQTDPDE
jgi:conjugative transposon protein TcpC